MRFILFFLCLICYREAFSQPDMVKPFKDCDLHGIKTAESSGMTLLWK